MDRADCGPRAELAGRVFRWLSSTPGRDLVERERACVEAMLGDLFGYFLLQIGWPREFIDPAAHSPIRNHIVVVSPEEGPGAGLGVIGDAGALPIAGDSVDAVFLPHTLDFSRDPHQVLREAERVLIPEGRVLILGLNPWSTWGLRRLLHGARGVPWCANFIGARRVCDWLSLLGFDLERHEPLVFLPPMGRSALMRQIERFEPLGRRWFPALSGAYAIRAVKRVSTLTPVQPRWNVRSRVLPGHAVEPTARGANRV